MSRVLSAIKPNDYLSHDSLIYSWSTILYVGAVAFDPRQC
jgi:hypothetical protein